MKNLILNFIFILILPTLYVQSQDFKEINLGSELILGDWIVTDVIDYDEYNNIKDNNIGLKKNFLSSVFRFNKNMTCELLITGVNNIDLEFKEIFENAKFWDLDVDKKTIKIGTKENLNLVHIKVFSSDGKLFFKLNPRLYLEVKNYKSLTTNNKP